LIFLCENCYALLKKCPPKLAPPLPPKKTFFFKSVKNVRFPVLFCFFITSIFYEIIPITKKINLSIGQIHPHFFITTQTSTRNCYFYLFFFLCPEFFFFKLNLRKIIIAITIHVTSTYNPSDQKETKFRFYYD